MILFFLKLLSSFTCFKEKKKNQPQTKTTKDKISWETQRGNFISFLNIVRKITCYLREKRNKVKEKSKQRKGTAHNNEVEYGSKTYLNVKRQ